MMSFCNPVIRYVCLSALMIGHRIETERDLLALLRLFIVLINAIEIDLLRLYSIVQLSTYDVYLCTGVNVGHES